jgi:uncharacterized RDD family membrane protein YckC
MKCPTCDYIGFETSDRCRNCGYDFGHATPAPAAPELRLHADDVEGALKELDIRNPPPVVEARGPVAGGLRGRSAGHSAARQPDIDKVLQNLDRVLGEAPSAADLPLFDDDPAVAALAPLVDAGATPRRPLAVRRTTPDPARLRSRPVRHQGPTPRPLELPLPDAPEVVGAGLAYSPSPTAEPITAAPPVRRVLAAALDLTILGAIDLVVVYFTLRMCGLTTAQIAVLPPIPLGAFFLLVNGGYLASFTAAGGQTIGKMAFGLKVVGHANLPVSAGLSVVRALGCLASVASLGIGFLPALFGEGGRAIEDRLADTRVVRISAV